MCIFLAQPADRRNGSGAKYDAGDQRVVRSWEGPSSDEGTDHWAPVYSCTHWLRPRDTPQLPPSPHLGSCTRALLISRDRRHLFVTPCDIHSAVCMVLHVNYNLSTMYSFYGRVFY
jgi:hypothetical protein